MKITAIVVGISVLCVVLFSSCEFGSPTSVPLDNNNHQNDGPAVDNHNYAPLQVGNEWTYIQIGHHGVLRGESKFDKHTTDTIVIKITEKLVIDGVNKFVVAIDKYTIDSTVYHLPNATDSLFKSQQPASCYDTLTVVGDSILPRPSQINILSSVAPFFNFIDYPSDQKTVVNFKGKKLLLAHNASAYYLDTYGLIKWENRYAGNGWGFVYTIRLIKFNHETIDSTLIDSITWLR